MRSRSRNTSRTPRVAGPPARALACGAATAIALLAAWGCGGGGSGTASTASAGAPSAAQLLAETFSPGNAPDSGKVALAVLLASPQGGSAAGSEGRAGPGGGAAGAAPGRLAVALAGPFDRGAGSAAPSFALQLSSAGVGRPLALAATSARGQLYLTVGGRTYRAPGAADAQLSAAYGAASGAAGAGGSMSPLHWLSGPQLQGTGTAGDGTPVTILSAVPDAGAMIGALAPLTGAGSAILPSEARTFAARALSALTSAPGPAEAEVWTGTADHRLRRLTVTLTAGAGARTSLRLDLSLGDLGLPQAISAPAHALPAEGLEQALARAGS